MRFTNVVLATTLATLPALTAQESYWVASRRTNDLHQVDPGGNILNTVTLSVNLRSAHQAPDGKVWVVRYIMPTFDIYDPATGIATPVTAASGNPYSIAFDAAGHAWVSGGSSVEEFDANGNPLNSYLLSAGSPLGICVDNGGNKWIAHRTSPASISRIDGTTGVVTNHLFGTTTNMQPVDVIADYRDFTTSQPSHIWVIGDGSGDIAEFDAQGNFLNLYPTSFSSISGITPDLDGDLWIVNRSGSLAEYDTAGNQLNSFALPTTDALGVSVDFLNRVWVTDRVTFNCTSAPCPPCLIHRVDPATGTVEVPAETGIGTQDQLSTMFEYAMIVDPLGDLDGDSAPNAIEAVNRLSPLDPQSLTLSVSTTGSSQLGGNLSIDFFTSGASTTSSALFSAGTSAPQTFPGLVGSLLIALPAPVSLPVQAGAYSVPLAIPNDPALADIAVYLQAVIVSGPNGPEFANRTSFRTW